MKVKSLILLTAIMLTTLACSFTVNVPTVKVGDVQTLTLSEPLPTDLESTTTVEMDMGAGNLNLSNDADGLIEGEVKYNIPEWKPVLTVDSNSVLLKQTTQGQSIGIPSQDVRNDWNIKLSKSVPMDLRINAGAYSGKMDLGGLRLNNLEISDGASTNTLDFSAVNPEQLNLFTYKTGASTVTMTGLSNANFSKMVFEGGAGTYHLNFDGNLQRDADVKITSGVSTLQITIPRSVHAIIDVSGGLKDVSTEGTWTTTDNSYETGSTGPTLTIRVEMGVGTLSLVQGK
jgi:hypothetical protein